jgi:hypothetical protein
MPTQNVLSAAQYITLTDKLALACQYLLAAVGDEDASGTAAYAARLARDVVVDLTGSANFQITADLATPTGSIVTALARENTLASYFSEFNGAVNRHIGGDIGAFLTAGSVRVHSLVKRCVNTAIPAANVFPPITTLGTVAVTGSGAGTFTVGTPVDTAKYGGAQVALKVINQPIGAASVVATVTGVDATGATRTWTGTLTNGATTGTVVNLAGTGVTAGVSVSAVAFTGGTNGDDFEVITREDRTL